MKKFLCAMSLGLVAIMFVGCGKEEKAVDSINNHIIERRDNLFVGSDDNFYATFVTGEREEPYALDGVVGELVPFGIVTLARNDNKMLNSDEYNFVLTIGEEQKTGKLEKSPYDNTYSADVGVNATDDAEIKLAVTIDGQKFEQVLFNESKNFTIGQDEAIKIAGRELADEINALLETGNVEAMVKILKDYSGETNRYFWYVGVVSNDGDAYGVLIDTMTGDIVSKKV